MCSLLHRLIIYRSMHICGPSFIFQSKNAEDKETGGRGD